ncbi:hypothetical protein [Methanoculleus sp.]|uniref:hypothetical protein n=1 Tax=Methanoculleus sp. TaxID=90427 RepID=UPI001BD50B01|nr:hypothetical protein [Methanoculleus sp.]
MTSEVGTFSPGPDGIFRVSDEANRYRIESGDIWNLLVYERVTRITQTAADGVTIEGHAAMNASGKAVYHSAAERVSVGEECYSRLVREGSRGEGVR